MSAHPGPVEPPAPHDPEDSGAVAPAEPPLEWTINPWKRSPRRALLTVLFFVLFGGVMLRLGLAPFTSVVLWVALVCTVSPAFWVLRCRVDQAGVARRLLFVWERRTWEGIGRVKLGRHGLFIYPRGTPNWLDAFRGLWLPFEEQPAEEFADLKSAVRQRLGAHGL